MKKTHFLLAIMLTSSLLVTACNRGGDSSDNPADSGGGSTATGSGTMSAKIDGQNWTATSGTVFATYTGNNLTVIGSQVQGTSAGTFNITIANVTGTGEFRLGLAPGVGGAQGIGAYGTAAGSASTAQAWATTNTETGTVNITRFDTQNKIVAGTFSFRCRAASPNFTPEIRNITDGRFDARWQ